MKTVHRRVIAASLVFFAFTAGYSTASAAEKNEAMQRLLQQAQKIRQLAICSDYSRRNDVGPRNPDDLTQVSKFASDGAPSCQYLLGRWHELGQGMPVDLAAALGFYQSAAPTFPVAKVALGRMAEQGLGRPASPSDALTLYQEASAAEEPTADIALGSLYERGVAVEKDLKAAATHYRKAAKRWNDDAWGHLDRLQSAHTIFAEEEITADRKVWRGLYYTRLKNEIGKAPEFEKRSESRTAELQLTYTRGAAEPAVEVLTSSGDPGFDASIRDVSRRVPMPPAPVYSATDSTYVFKFPVNVLAAEPKPASPRTP
jgi:TPR repeat protein